MEANVCQSIIGVRVPCFETVVSIPHFDWIIFTLWRVTFKVGVTRLVSKQAKHELAEIVFKIGNVIDLITGRNSTALYILSPVACLLLKMNSNEVSKYM
uniref:Uncharacterized protein n=1 Tax=Cyanistes caeruleus TaxID=156563 RepID=A0A8C0VC90_CYACU